MEQENQSAPLSGYRVLELGNLIAAPYCGRLFAEFGAEVIKVERPRTGDELRQWRALRGDTSMFWYLHARNKKSITLDLRRPEGQELAKRLVERIDVLIENFRPGTLEQWNLGPEQLRHINPDLIIVRISGYGQTGPYRDRPGFASVAEGIGGMRHIIGYPDRPPVRTGISLGDSLAGLYGTIGALIALLHRDRVRREREQRHQGAASPAERLGQVVDVALYESIFAVMESLIPDYDAYGVIKQRSGSLLHGIAPTNIYPCRNGQWVIIGGNSDAIFRRLMQAIGRADLADDPRFAHNPGRWEHHELLDAAIADWTQQRTMDEVMAVMLAASIPAGPIYDAADIARDEHYHARGMLETHHVTIDGDTPTPVRFPGIVPRLEATPGHTRWLGPRLGEHNHDIYAGMLELSADQIAHLQELGII
ncbi:CoA transferase [Chloroflexus sp.]|uniref:CaiB/BaiF CoA transferase family protein n=1 Tax=Chloroflexus sp. TaxID=1904827 RepID=UPI00298F144C|nr:CoA transferase [Chloroflexus sp.]MDW8403833.1 CoA transferase [Chloroflexus sp.]